MNNPVCTDKEKLIAYLYDECGNDERARVETHLAGCAFCARELRDLRGVRKELANWSPPEQAPGIRLVSDNDARAYRGRYASVRVWALAAAAVLVLAAAAAVANIEIRYGADGVVVKTGWTGGSQISVPRAASADAPWRSDLASLERQMRGRMDKLQSTAIETNDAGVIRQVRMLIDESEKRQQRELALRVAQLVRDVDTQRRADLLRIQQGFGRIEGLTNTEVSRQREMLDYLVRVSQRPRQ